MRRVRLHPDVAAIVSAAGNDAFLQGCITWRKGGTQTIDGHWRLLRKRAGLRGINTKLSELLTKAVFVHQWSHWHGPGTDLLSALGSTVLEARSRRCAAIAAARAAALAEWEAIGMSSDEEDEEEVRDGNAGVDHSLPVLERARKRRCIERGRSLLTAEAEQQLRTATRRRVAREARQAQVRRPVGQRLVRGGAGAHSHALRQGTGRGKGRGRGRGVASVAPAVDAAADPPRDAAVSSEEAPVRTRRRGRVVAVSSDEEQQPVEVAHRSVEQAVADLLRDRPCLARGSGRFEPLVFRETRFDDGDD